MKRELRQALGIFGFVLLAIAVLVRLPYDFRYIGHIGSALIAAILLYTPVLVAAHRREDLLSYGFTLAPYRRGLKFALWTSLVVFPVFALGFFLFYGGICNSEIFSRLAPVGFCRRFLGFAGIQAPVVNWSLVEYVLMQIFVVALSEELFFRGMLLYLLEKAFPPKRRFLGGGLGWALFISAALFALVHLPKSGDPRSLATFFPGLVFGWLRSATGSIFASTVVHAGSNIVIRLLTQMAFR